MRFEALSPRCTLQLAGRAQNAFSKANSYLWKGFVFSLHKRWPPDAIENDSGEFKATGNTGM